MVRHKTRWLLACFEFECEIVSPTKGNNEDLPTIERKEIYRELVKTLTICYGLSAHALMADVMVRHVDPDSKLVMIRVPRATAGKIRAGITYMTTLGKNNIVASVISVNGSVRTARLSTMKEIRKMESPKSLIELKRLDRRLQVIREIE